MSRRFVITIGVDGYRAPLTNLTSPADADRVRKLFAGLGYQEALPGLGILSANDIPGRIERWVAERRLTAEDTVVLYFAGHGEKNAERHYLLCFDSALTLWTTALATEDLARPLVASEVGHLLFILDTCFAGGGGGDITKLAVELTGTQREPADRWALTAARGRELALDNAFVDALTHTLRALGPAPGVGEVTEGVNAYLTEHGGQQSATYATVDNKGGGSFFHSPHGTGDLDRDRLAALHQDDRHDFGSDARGVGNATEPGDYFTGRTAALGELVSWLRSDTHDRRARVVVGDPGSGKSALLGRLLLLTDPHHPAGRDTSSDLDVVPLNAARDSVVSELAAVLGHPGADRNKLLRILAERTTPLTVIVDALDQAIESTQIAHKLLEPLTTLPALRLIIGTRRQLLPELGQAVQVIDLDDPEYLDDTDIADYAEKVLRDEQDPESLSPYRARPEQASDIGDEIAARAVKSFLVARLNARALVKGQITVDTTEPGWQNRLPSDTDRAYADYLDRFGDERPKVVRLLRPLAYARGTGLPGPTLWAPLAGALSGVPCTYEDVRWLHEHAGDFIKSTMAADGPVYYLFHETFAKYLRIPYQDRESHAAITDTLLSLVPNGREWTLAHSYIRDHLATHAALAGRLDPLLADPDFLVHANPDELLLALHSATSTTGRLTCAIYRASAGTHRQLDPPRRRRLLATDAARFDAEDLRAALATGMEWAPRWATGQQTSPALHATLTGHTQSVRSVACTSVEGRAVAVTASHDGTVRTWDIETGLPQVTLDGELVHAVACTTFGDHPVAVTGGEDGGVRRWDLVTGTGTVVGRQFGEVQAVACAVVDGRPVAVTGGEDAKLHLWDLETGEHTILATGRAWLTAIGCTQTGDGPVAVALSPDGVMQVWDLTHRALLRTIGPHRQATDLACATLRGRPVVVSVGDSVVVWDLATGITRLTMPGDQGWMNAVACTTVDDRPVAVVGGDNGVLHLRDLATGEVRASVAGHQSWINAVACAEVKGQPVAITASDDGTSRTWDLTIAATRRPAAQGHSGNITAVAGGRVTGRTVVVSASEDHTARVWDLATGELRATLAGHTGGVVDVVCTEIGDRPVAVTGGTDATVRVWDLDTGEPIHVLTGHQGFVRRVACTSVAGRPTAISASSDQTIRVWDLTTGTLVHVLETDEVVMTILTCTVVGEPVLLAGGPAGSRVRMWDLASGQLITMLKAWGVPSAIVPATIDGRPMAIVPSATAAATWLWDLTNGTLDVSLSHADPVLDAAYTTIGTELVVVVTVVGGTVEIWDLTTHSRRATLVGHAGTVSGVSCVTVGGRPAALTTGKDGTVRLWDLETSEELAVFDLPGRIGGTVYVESEERLVVASGWDLVVLERKGNG